MRTLRYILLLLTLNSLYANAQSTATWMWGKADVADIAAGNLAPNQNIITAAGNKALSGALQTFGYNAFAFYYGNYLFTEYDNTGLAGTAATIGGKAYIFDAHADAAGNWYLLGEYYDTVSFPGGPTFTKDISSTLPPYFICKLNSGTLTTAWAQTIGIDNNTGVATFTVTANGIYMPFDSATYTAIRKYDLATGTYTELFRQQFASYISAIAADGPGNIYLAGACPQGDMNFNGHVVTTTYGTPQYLVRYRANGDHDWDDVTSEGGCGTRDLSISGDTAIFYSGTIYDSSTLGGIHYHAPTFARDNIVARIDSSGTVQWVAQLNDTFSTTAYACATSLHDGVSMADGSFSLFTSIRGALDWGNGVTTNSGIHIQTAVINYAAASGLVNWAKPIVAENVTTTNIVTNGTDIWVTGGAFDSAAYYLDSISVPVVSHVNTSYMALLHTSNAVTAVPAVTARPQFNIYPVPATNTVYATIPPGVTGNIHVKITDISGRQVLDKLMNGNAGKLQIPVNDYDRGLYYITLSSAGNTTVQKLILE